MAAEVEIVANFTDNASGGLSGFGASLGNLGNIVTGIKSAFDLVGQAVDAAVGFFQPFVDSAAESELAVAQLEGVLRATGGAAGLTSQELQDMANALQNTTRFSDETILAGESLLLTFRNIGEEAFQRAVPAMVDMAEIFGSVDSAAMQLGKALNDPLNGLGALTRAGITFSDAQKEMIKNFVESGDLASAQAIILGEVEAQVNGLAEAMGDTFAGRWDIFQNKLDTVRETIGGALLPLLTDMVNVFESMLPVIQEWGDMLAQAISSGDFTQVVTRIQEVFGSIDWENVSQTIADGIASIDWGRVGNIIAEGLGQLAIIIADVIQQIDWGALLGSIAQAVADLISGLFGFVDWNDMITSAAAGFRYVGQQIVQALWAGLQYEWAIIEQMFFGRFNSLINGVKAILGISSPSSIFAEIGRNIVQGIIGGFQAAWETLMDIAGNALSAFFDLFGIDLSSVLGGGSSASGLGTAGGGTAPGSGTTTGGSGSVVNNFYGPVYFGDMSSIGYDCPSPNPLVSASANQLVATGFS